MEEKYKFPTEMVKLPSQGLLYPKENPLSTGEVEMKYMGAREEDILTNENYIRQDIVIDKLLQSMIVTKINYDDLLIGDKDAIIIASRVLGYGKDYSFTTGKGEATVDLSLIDDKPLSEELKNANNKNEFFYTLPATGAEIGFKLLTHGDFKKIDAEIRGLKKIDPQGSFDVTTRLKFMITSVGGERDMKTIREFIDNRLLSRDAKALREYAAKISPGVNLKANVDFGNGEEEVSIPINLNFFWPE